MLVLRRLVLALVALPTTVASSSASRTATSAGRVGRRLSRRRERAALAAGTAVVPPPAGAARAAASTTALSRGSGTACLAREPTAAVAVCRAALVLAFSSSCRVDEVVAAGTGFLKMVKALRAYRRAAARAPEAVLP